VCKSIGQENRLKAAVFDKSNYNQW